MPWWRPDSRFRLGDIAPVMAYHIIGGNHVDVPCGGEWRIDLVTPLRKGWGNSKPKENFQGWRKQVKNTRIVY